MKNTFAWIIAGIILLAVILFIIATGTKGSDVYASHPISGTLIIVLVAVLGRKLFKAYKKHKVQNN